MKTYKARGIVLHTIKYGDSSAVAYLLTDTSGRRTYMVQGLGRSASGGKGGRSHGNKAALLQPMFLVEFEGLASSRAEMDRFRELHAAVPLRSIPFDVRKSTVALFMAEMLYRLVREVEANSPLFDFVWESVVALDAMPAGAGVANFHLWFMVGLSRHLGFFPAGEWAPGHWFDIREGVFTPIEPRGACFSQENARLLGCLMDLSFGTEIAAPIGISGADASGTSSLHGALSALAPNRDRRVDFLNSMLAFFGYHLDATRDVRSVDILREVF